MEQKCKFSLTASLILCYTAGATHTLMSLCDYPPFSVYFWIFFFFSFQSVFIITSTCSSKLLPMLHTYVPLIILLGSVADFCGVSMSRNCACIHILGVAMIAF